MALDDALASIVALGEATNAYTTGTPANLELSAAVGTLTASLADGQAQASTTLSANPLATPANVVDAVAVAGYLAGATGSLAWLANLQALLSRP